MWHYKYCYVDKECKLIGLVHMILDQLEQILTFQNLNIGNLKFFGCLS